LAEGDNVRRILPGFRSPLELLHLIYSAIDSVLRHRRSHLLLVISGHGSRRSGIWCGCSGSGAGAGKSLPVPGAEDL